MTGCNVDAKIEKMNERLDMIEARIMLIQEQIKKLSNDKSEEWTILRLFHLH